MIQELKRVADERNWSRKYSEILENISRALSAVSRDEPRLTKFQNKALSHPGFFRDWTNQVTPGHLIIQGATSAGKTLLSDLNIIDTLNSKHSAIVIVPLKAMVHERTLQLRRELTIESEERQFRVFGASSDYLENDEMLLNGEFDVAVIVYEKFYAMLGLNDGALMKKCRLLVVDELSMLNHEQRGPKLEMCLEIVKDRYPETRIMGMATCDCETEFVRRWLDVKSSVFSTARPVALEEHILMTDGKGIVRFIPADFDPSEDNLTPKIPEEDEKIAVKSYRADQRQDEKKKNLLLAVLERVYRRTPDAKLMVFVGSQDEARSVAGLLKEKAQDYFLPYADNKVFLDKVEYCEHDDVQEELLKSFLPCGIAFHHSGVSSTLREIIEEEFRKKDSSLRAIVATETLTVGVNLPVDVMVMMTNKVPRGTGKREALNVQEYRNYIGRAGRLGLSDRSGVSYLFVEDEGDFETYRRSISSKGEIVSALVKSKPETLAPYYLSLIYNRVCGDPNADSRSSSFTASQLREIFNKSFAHACGDNTFDQSKLYEILYSYYLASQSNESDDLELRGPRRAEKTYALDPFGDSMAKYALSVNTYNRIYTYFYIGHKHGGLPLGVSREDLAEDRYLLEILYRVCRHCEIEQSTCLRYPSDKDGGGDKKARAEKAVRDALVALTEEKDEDGNVSNRLFCDTGDDNIREKNDIWAILNSEPNDKTLKMQAAMRAVLLYYWTRGLPVEKIKEKTGFGAFVRVRGGDIERLAEMAAFHLDAILNCLRGAFDNETGSRVLADVSADREFYALESRVKYGMPFNLTVLASKHVRGVDRPRLLELKKVSDRLGLTPVQYLFSSSDEELSGQNLMTGEQQAQLMRAIEQRGNTSRIDTLIDIVKNDAGPTIEQDELDSLSDIAKWCTEEGQKDPSAIYYALKTLTKAPQLNKIRISTDGQSNLIRLDCGGMSVKIAVIGKSGIEKLDRYAVKFFSDDEGRGRDRRILIVPNNSETDKMCSACTNYAADAVFDNVYFASLIANTLRLGLDRGESLIDFLSDVCGVLTANKRYFPILQYLRKHRRCDNLASDDKRYVIIRGSSLARQPNGSEKEDALISALSRTDGLGGYDVIPWGSELVRIFNLNGIPEDDEDACRDISDCGSVLMSPIPTVIMLERDNIRYSDSLNKLIYRICNLQRRKSLILFFSEKAKNDWYSADEGDRTGNRWNGVFQKKPQTYVVPNTPNAVSRVRQFISSFVSESFLIGISYAHYESQDQSICWKRDTELVGKLADKLREEYGEDSIFFDRFYPARLIFARSRGKEESLEAYRQCKVNLVVWNHWSIENENCRREREEAIFKTYDKNESSCLFLTPKDVDRQLPDLPRDEFSTQLSDSSLDIILEAVKSELKKLGF